ncbi:acyl-CoA thioesterase [Berryella wangjianweii]|uniref:Acyl-CoA thioesterase n=1 Tax=Berryella wangjianweii TaxID=2734634 RepID=A0A6M8J086_9ACTN|nr:thioesterase family protein [Berryella wangjianweii]QKF06967.1 acyl-CoA thioesterase [Berryella wangjianweii]
MIGCYDIDVRYGETDSMGVVYHGNYALYFEDARTKFLAELGFSYADMERDGLMAPIVELNVSYRTPLRYGDVARVVVYISKLTPVRVTYAYEVYRKGMDVASEKPCATGETTVCCVDASTFQPVSMKRATPALYERYVQAKRDADAQRGAEGSGVSSCGRGERNGVAQS